MTEDYVSFEVAVLLKEKGFDELIPTYFEFDPEFDEEEDKGDLIVDDNHRNSTFYNPCCYSAPTLQMACKWLREMHNIYISIQPDFPSEENYKMFWYWSANIIYENCISTKGYQCYIDTYEKALESAIKYCLENLI